MKIQLDLPLDLNKQLKIIKAEHGFKSLQQTIIEILKSQMEGIENGSEPRS